MVEKGLILIVWLAVLGQTPGVTGQKVLYKNANITVFSATYVEGYESLYVDSDNRHLYIGAVHTPKEDGEGYLFKVNSSNISNLVENATFGVVNSTKSGAIPCRSYTVRDKEILCRNFIKVIMTNASNSEDLLVCGTNSELPRCYSVPKNELRSYYGFDGKYKCSTKQDQSVTAVLGKDNKLYTGLAYETDGKIAIARNPIEQSRTITDLTTEPSDKWLKEAEFISSYPVTKADGTDEILFFFREIADEYENQHPAEVTYSRVAKVCEKDKGGNVNFLENKWTSYLKARLDCSEKNSDDQRVQSYDILQDTELVGDTVYAVFGKRGDVALSALCTYDVKDIAKVFESKIYWDQESSDKKWQEVVFSSEQYPGECVEDSTTLNEKILESLKKHPLMRDLVPSIYPPQLTSYKNLAFTQIVRSDFNGEPILYIGTDKGTVLKVLYSNDSNPIVLAEVQVSNHNPNPAPVNVMTKSDKDQSLYIGFNDKVVQVPMSQCWRYIEANTCNCSSDPHCVWISDTCITNTEQIEPLCSNDGIEIKNRKVSKHANIVVDCPVRNVNWFKSVLPSADQITRRSVQSQMAQDVEWNPIVIDNVKYLSIDGIGLSIINFVESDSGFYEARDVISDGKVVSTQLWITEPVSVPRDVLTFTEPYLSDQNKETCHGRIVYLFCKAVGPEGFEMRWLGPDGQNISKANSSRVEWAKVNECTVDGLSWLSVEVSSASVGNYSCEITDGNVYETQHATIKLQKCVTPNSITCQNEKYAAAKAKYERYKPTDQGDCNIEVIRCADCCKEDDTCPAN